jgi:DNA polymerase-3 subunit epsilon
MDKLNLQRPIVFFDLETTGTDRENDRIIEMATLHLFPDGAIVRNSQRFNPGIPIKPEATEVHGIKDEDVANEPTFKEYAVDIHGTFSGCDIAGYNSNNFDVPMLYHEFKRAGIDWNYFNHKFIDVGNIFKIREPRTLEAAVKFFCGREHIGAHGAQADTEATLEVFKAQLERYEDLPESIEELALYSNYGNKLLDLSGKFKYNSEGVIVFNFGEYRNEPAKEHPDYLDWMWGKNFPADTNSILQDLFAEIESSKDDDEGDFFG